MRPKQETTPNPSRKKPRKSNAGKPAYIPSNEHLETAYSGAKKGLSYSEIARAIGISPKTLQRNLDQFGPKIKKGRDESFDKNCERVESSMLKRCLGYWVNEETKEKRIDGNGKATVIIKTLKKHVIPSDVLIMFYLCNRNPEKWQSINKPAGDKDTNKGEIRKWYEEMEKEIGKLNENPFGQAVVEPV